MSCTISPQISSGDLVQFLVHHWNELIERTPVAVADAGKKNGDGRVTHLTFMV